MERNKKIIQISLIGILVNLVLVISKMVTGVMTGSIAIVIDALNNLSDALSSVIIIIGTAIAGRAPDKKHPYGYGQVEYISSVTVAFVVLLAGVASLRVSFDKILHPQQANYTIPSLVVLILAVAVKLAWGRYVRGQGRQYNSDALMTSGMDSMFDGVISVATLAAALISMIFGVSVEGWLGALVSFVIFKAGIEVLMESLGNMIGTRIDRELSRKLKEHIGAYEQVNGAYDLVLHRYGPERLIGSVHIEVADHMDARELHGLTRRITEDIFVNYGIILTVGIYASNTEDGICAELKSHLLELLENRPEILQMHGFYVDTGRMLVSFDLIIDFKAKNKLEIRDGILAKMADAYPEYTFQAILDNDFSD
jgi:cation diffusion facilitator family transporter